MPYRTCLGVALATVLAVAVGAGPTVAATPAGGADSATQHSFPGPSASTKQKQLAYARYCGAEGKRPHARRARQRRACLDAMARLAAGKASSPDAACRALKSKRSKGRKASRAAYKRCVRAGSRLLKDQKAAEMEAAEEHAAALAAEQAEALEEQAEALQEQAAENDQEPVEQPQQ